jgi:hypothetical protein
MAFVIADRVQETCAAPGTGTVSLLGAVTGFQTFSAGIGNNNSTYYCIADQGGANWEVGIGTYSSTGSTLSRDTILSSSNGGSATNFSSGTQSVFCTYPSEKSVNLDSSGNVSALGTISSGTWHGTTIAIAYGGTNGTATPTAGAVAYGNGTAYAFTSAGNAGEVLTSNGSSAPTWTASSSPAKASGAIIVNTTTVSEDYTIPTGSNGHSVGPIEIASGYSVTVSAGQRWLIV